MTRTVYRACNLCEAICGVELAIDGSRIVSLRAGFDAGNPTVHNAGTLFSISPLARLAARLGREHGALPSTALAVAAAIGKGTPVHGLTFETLASAPHGLDLGALAVDTFTLIGRRHLRSNNSWMHGSKQHPGISYNDLTDAAAVDAVSGNAALNGIAVEVTRAT